MRTIGEPSKTRVPNDKTEEERIAKYKQFSHSLTRPDTKEGFYLHTTRVLAYRRDDKEYLPEKVATTYYPYPLHVFRSNVELSKCDKLKIPYATYVDGSRFVTIVLEEGKASYIHLKEELDVRFKICSDIKPFS